MKSTGIVRKTDQLGRLVIPKETRKSLNLKVNDSIEIFVQNDTIIFKKYRANRECVITGDVLDSNFEFAPGIVLSPKGAEMLLKQLQDKLGK